MSSARPSALRANRKGAESDVSGDETTHVRSTGERPRQWIHHSLTYRNQCHQSDAWPGRVRPIYPRVHATRCMVPLARSLCEDGGTRAKIT